MWKKEVERRSIGAEPALKKRAQLGDNLIGTGAGEGEGDGVAGTCGEEQKLQTVLGVGDRLAAKRGHGTGVAHGDAGDAHGGTEMNATGVRNPESFNDGSEGRHDVIA